MFSANSILWPLSLLEWRQLIEFVANAPPDLPKHYIFCHATQAFNSLRAKVAEVQLPSSACESVWDRTQVLAATSRLPLTPAALPAELKFAVRPAVTSCFCKTQRPLTEVEVGHRAWFYPLHGPSGQGKVFELHCGVCGAQYAAQNYRPAGTELRLPYSSSNVHPIWALSTRETAIDRRLFARFDEDFYHQYSSFQAAVDTYNCCELHGE